MEPSWWDLAEPMFSLMFMQVGVSFLNWMLRPITPKRRVEIEEERRILQEIDEFCGITDPDLVTR